MCGWEGRKEQVDGRPEGNEVDEKFNVRVDIHVCGYEGGEIRWIGEHKGMKYTCLDEEEKTGG